jgi:hypothetical protein
LQGSFLAVTRHFEKFDSVHAAGVSVAKQLKELEVKIDNIIKDNKKVKIQTFHFEERERERERERNKFEFEE